MSASPDCDVPEHGYLVHDLEEEREDRAALRREVKHLRMERDGWLRRLGVDPEDVAAVTRLREDLIGFNRFKGRQVTGRLRASDGQEAHSVAHYEAKLAAKKAEVRQHVEWRTLALEYIDLLQKASGRSAGFLHVHGWREDLAVVQRGRELRTALGIQGDGEAQ